MLIRLIALLLISFVCLPLSAEASSNLPQDVKESINKDFANWQTQLQTLTNDSTTDTQKNTLSGEKKLSSLGAGYAKYNINLSSSSVSQNTYITSSNKNLLRFTGYVFLVEGINGSNALAFTEDTGNRQEIIGLASSEDFSDADFKIPIEKAKQLVGFNSSSKLIYDEGHRTIALVTITDQGEKVAVLQDSSPLGLKRYDVLSFQELIEKVQDYEAEQSKIAYLNNEPTSGGGGSSSTGNGGAGNLQNVANSSTVPPYIWIVSVIVLIGFVSHVIYRKRKQRSLSH